MAAAVKAGEPTLESLKSAEGFGGAVWRNSASDCFSRSVGRGQFLTRQTRFAGIWQNRVQCMVSLLRDKIQQARSVGNWYNIGMDRYFNIAGPCIPCEHHVIGL